MNTDERHQTLEGLSHEQIERHIQRAHQLRNEAIADLIKGSLAGLRDAVRRVCARVIALVNYRDAVITGNQRTV